MANVEKAAPARGLVRRGSSKLAPKAKGALKAYLMSRYNGGRMPLPARAIATAEARLKQLTAAGAHRAAARTAQWIDSAVLRPRRREGFYKSLAALDAAIEKAKPLLACA